jgi:hypothetical protein
MHGDCDLMNVGDRHAGVGDLRGARREAVRGLRWFRDRTTCEALARDHGISRATVYRCGGRTGLADGGQSGFAGWRGCLPVRVAGEAGPAPR